MRPWTMYGNDPSRHGPVSATAYLDRMGVLPSDRDWTWAGMMRMRIKAMEAELRARGHDVERAFSFEGQDTHDGAGWVVRVDGELVATGPSIGALEGALRRWLSLES